MVLKMAAVSFSVFVLIFAKYVYAYDTNCDQCIRQGFTWCKEIGTGGCESQPQDDWCESEQENLPVNVTSRPGQLITPNYVTRTLFIGRPNRVTFKYEANSPREVDIAIVSTTQNDHIDLKQYEHKCTPETCMFTVEATAKPNFCSLTSTVNEFMTVKITFKSIKEEAVVYYHVPCACPCSSKVEKMSPNCSKNGDLTCGMCKCYKGWEGVRCEEPICIAKRGDVQCTNLAKPDVECSGNGYCSIKCDNCICFNDREGSQYLKPENHCSDICMESSECDTCLRNGTPGICTCPNREITILPRNLTESEARDEYDRRVWVRCNETVNDCYISYVAMMDESDQIVVMIMKSCNDVEAAGSTGSTQVPMILAILGLLAAVAAVAGVMLWKHMNTVPPLPLTDPQYENIDAEDCTGENPLYKPPTSSFKNPTYGKW